MKLYLFFFYFIPSCLICFLPVLATASSSNLFTAADKSFLSERLTFSTQYQFFQTEANYTPEGGQFVSLSSNNKYQISDLDLGLRWTTGSTWGFYSSTRWSQAESRNFGITRKNSQITMASVGMDLLLVSTSKFQLIPDFRVVFPMQRVEKNRDEVILSEGALEISPSLIAKANWGILQPFASIGFTYRDEGRSSLLPYSLGTELAFSSFRLGADLNGYFSLIKDSQTTAERQSVLYRNGGSFHNNTTDPSLLNAKTWISWKGPQLSVRGGIGTSMTGASTASGLTFFAGLDFSFGSHKSDLSGGRSTRTRSEPKTENQDSLQNFEETMDDGVDQNLFRRPTPAPKKKAKPQLSPAEQRKQLQQELDQTEFQIELKKPTKNKRKK